MLSKDEILNYLDECNTSQRQFIRLNSEYHIWAKSRLLLFRSDTSWSLVHESVGYDVSQLEFGTSLTYLGPGFHCSAYFHGGNIAWIPLCAIGDSERIEEATFEPNNSVIEAQFLDSTYTIAKDDRFRKLQEEQDLCLDYPISVLRWLIDMDNPFPFLKLDQISRHLHTDQVFLAEIHEWHHLDFDDIMNQMNLPSKQSSYQVIAEMLASRQHIFKDTLNEPNNHYLNWPVAGSL